MNAKQGGFPLYTILEYKEIPHRNTIGGSTYIDRLTGNPLNGNFNQDIKEDVDDDTDES